MKTTIICLILIALTATAQAQKPLTNGSKPSLTIKVGVRIIPAPQSIDGLIPVTPIMGATVTLIRNGIVVDVKKTDAAGQTFWPPQRGILMVITAIAGRPLNQVMTTDPSQGQGEVMFIVAFDR